MATSWNNAFHLLSSPSETEPQLRLALAGLMALSLFPFCSPQERLPGGDSSRSLVLDSVPYRGRHSEIGI